MMHDQKNIKIISRCFIVK